MPRKETYRKRPEAYNLYQKEWAAKHRAKVRASARLRHRLTRERVIAKYGGQCACSGCAIKQFEFLAIDHVLGGGTKERKEKFPNAQSFYNYLDKNPVDPLYQLLCHNCNSSKGYYGYCLHEKENNGQ